jgi:hypothetical protein
MIEGSYTDFADALICESRGHGEHPGHGEF